MACHVLVALLLAAEASSSPAACDVGAVGEGTSMLTIADAAQEELSTQAVSFRIHVTKCNKDATKLLQSTTDVNLSPQICKCNLEGAFGDDQQYLHLGSTVTVIDGNWGLKQGQSYSGMVTQEILLLQQYAEPDEKTIPGAFKTNLLEDAAIGTQATPSEHHRVTILHHT